MATLQPKKIILDEINNGNEFVNKQKVDAKVINSTIEASAYAQALATNQPNIDDIDKEGTPSVEIEETENGTPRFKFSSLLQTNESGGGGTTVTVGGVVQATWEADTKLDKITTPNKNFPLVYVLNKDGSDGSIVVTSQATANTIAMTDAYGRLSCSTPAQPYHTTPRQYVDDGLSGKLDIFSQASGSYRLYGVDNNGNQTMRYVVQRQGNVAAGWIACYRSASEIYDHDDLDAQTSATLIVPTPTKLWACANKKYVDENSGKVYKHNIYFEDNNSGAIFNYYFLSSSKDSIVNKWDLPTGTYMGSDSYVSLYNYDGEFIRKISFIGTSIDESYMIMDGDLMYGDTVEEL